MKYWLLKGDVPTNIQEHFNAIELTEEELLILTNISGLCGPSKEVETYFNTRKKIRKVL